MKTLISIVTVFISFNAFASVPYCNIAEVVDLVPLPTAAVKEFKMGEKLDLSTTDGSAKLTAEWNEKYQFYQINLFYGDLRSTSLVELPGKMGFLSLYDGKRSFQALCRFDLN